MTRFLCTAVTLVLAASGVVAAAGPAAEVRTAPDVRQLEISNTPFKGDFDGMFERRLIRVSVPYSRSLYFIDKGRERGLSAELVRDFERWINQKYAKKHGRRPITLYIVASTRDRLLPDLEEGLADMAVGNLTVTEERLKAVDFFAPDAAHTNSEILVTGPSSPPVAALDDLAGRTVHVRAASSYHASLVALNARFAAAGKPAVNLVLVPDALEDEDMLEMVDAGLLGAIVVDDWKAKMWAPVLPRVKVHSGIVLRPPARIGWAIRKGCPQLTAELAAFYTTWVKKQNVIPYRQKQYMKRVKALDSASAAAARQRFDKLVALFEKYGKKYGFDPLMLAAQGYQESTLDQKKKSPVGAIGVMQLMPATGRSMKVGDITAVEPNVHAGAKYMDQLMTVYFKDATFDEQNRTLFAFASYNAGPGNISKMRAEAVKRGLDPNRWFNHVETVTAARIGIETTTYVRNIFKYYVSYKLSVEAAEGAREAREAVPASK